MELNHSALRAFLAEKEISISELHRMVSEITDTPVSRPQMSRIVAGLRTARPKLIRDIATVIGEDAYTLLGPDDPQAALDEIAATYGLTVTEAAS